MPEGKLTPKQERFCREYVVDSNGTQAAIRAGYSLKTAQAQSSRMLSNVMVQGRVQQLMAEQNNRLNLTADVVLEELLLIAKSDISQAFDDAGNLFPLKEMPEGIRRVISGFEVLEEFEREGRTKNLIGYTKKIKSWDKVKALELLGKHLKLFTEKIEFEDKTGLAERLAKARKRKKE